MGLEVWTAFVVASVVLLAIPGATVTVVLGFACSMGRSTAVAAVPAVVLGDFVAMTISLLGAGAVLAASATWFAVLKYAGAIYLIWLGVQMWRSAPAAAGRWLTANAEPNKNAKVFWTCFVVTALNPKDIVFFIAFLPQFIDPQTDALTQFAVLEVTFLTMVALNISLWCFLGGRLRTILNRPERLTVANRIGACLLVGAGVLTSMAKRAS